MNFLQLVQRLHSETGRQGTAPAAVTGQTGMNQRLVNWILTAYEDIQGLHESWLFRRDDFSWPTIATVQNYTPAGVGIDDLAAWWFDPNHNNLSGIRLYSVVADEADLIYLPWNDYRTTYKFGSSRSQSCRSTIFSIKPNMSMDLWAIPDTIYTVNGEYVKTIQIMEANDDIPILPDYHMIIVWKGLMYYGAFEGAPEVYAHGKEEYDRILPRLEMNQLPKITWGAPLV